MDPDRAEYMAEKHAASHDWETAEALVAIFLISGAELDDHIFFKLRKYLASVDDLDFEVLLPDKWTTNPAEAIRLAKDACIAAQKQLEDEYYDYYFSSKD